MGDAQPPWWLSTMEGGDSFATSARYAEEHRAREAALTSNIQRLQAAHAHTRLAIRTFEIRL